MQKSSFAKNEQLNSDSCESIFILKSQVLMQLINNYTFQKDGKVNRLTENSNDMGHKNSLYFFYLYVRNQVKEKRLSRIWWSKMTTTFQKFITWKNSDVSVYCFTSCTRPALPVHLENADK